MNHRTAHGKLCAVLVRLDATGQEAEINFWAQELVYDLGQQLLTRHSQRLGHGCAKLGSGETGTVQSPNG